VSLAFEPPISAAIRIPSLYLRATTDDPVTYGYLNQPKNSKKKKLGLDCYFST